MLPAADGATARATEPSRDPSGRVPTRAVRDGRVHEPGTEVPRIDAQVTCPRCQERQPLPNEDGYTCRSCGAAWVFVTCGSCHQRFHMNPATRDWTCPNCGNHNGPVAPAHTPSTRPAMPSLNDRGPLLAIVAGVVVLVIAIWAIFMRDSGPTTAASPTLAVSSSAPVDTVAHLCTDVAADMPIRVDSVTRTEQAVRADAKTLKQEGNTEAAKAANTLADALGQLADALDTQGDTLAANQALQDALAALPC